MAITKLVSDSLGAGVGGSFVKLITSTSASSATNVDFDSTYINDDYYSYLLYITDIRPNTDATEPYIKFSTDNGSTFITCNSTRTYRGLNGAATGIEHNNGAFIQLGTDVGNDASQLGSHIIEMPGLTNTLGYKWGMYRTSAKHNVGTYNWEGGFEVPTTSAINFIRFSYSSGTIADNAKFTLYGVNS
jgi:hypothetical protein